MRRPGWSRWWARWRARRRAGLLAARAEMYKEAQRQARIRIWNVYQDEHRGKP